ncbi:siderophore ABC transporter substrate-binding protein [Nitrincola alkalisediminis]|uniref:siderophore ABC transporter substrate-binding protein n=1 Tax=Nitrincola alkalisediminis TaxID=1366656 RepID=UPI001CA85794|nr:siderophore ABC transporter substrate-binding protein [Nitrincola alkalisediminis]
MQLFRQVCGWVVLSVMLIGPVSAEILVQHKQGELRLQQVPQRVVTFDLGVLDSLDALGVDVVGVPKDFLPPHLTQYADDRYQQIGSLFEPDFEALAALKPDLIIIGGRSAPSFRQLSRLAPTLDLTHDYTDFLPDFYQNARILGKVFDKEEDVEARLSQIDTQLQDTRELAANIENGLVIITSGGRVSAYGVGSRTGWLHEHLGITPAVDNLKEGTHGDPVSFEFILKTDPEYLFVLDRDTAINSGAGAARTLLDNELMHQTRAWQADRVIYLNPQIWYVTVSGLNATPAMIEEVHDALQRAQ